ncbi:MAG TPA: hypothetical protein VGF14_08070 [Alphaproteobacteria bacterium]
MDDKRLSVHLDNLAMKFDRPMTVFHSEETGETFVGHTMLIKNLSQLPKDETKNRDLVYSETGYFSAGITMDKLTQYKVSRNDLSQKIGTENPLYPSQWNIAGSELVKDMKKEAARIAKLDADRKDAASRVATTIKASHKRKILNLKK